MPRCTLYGPGELEAHRHALLRRSVEDARLKAWYPGRWRRHSPVARFRTTLRSRDVLRRLTESEAEDDGRGTVLLRIRSNAGISSASLDEVREEGSRNEPVHEHKMRWQSFTQTIRDEPAFVHDLLLPPIVGGRLDEGGDRLFAIQLELDARPSSVREGTGTRARIDPPPCITLHSPSSDVADGDRRDCRGQGNECGNWEWKNTSTGEWIPISSGWVYPCATGANAAQPQLQQCFRWTNNHPSVEQASDSDEGLESSWRFPHQMDWCKVTSVSPVTQLDIDGAADGAIDPHHQEAAVYDFGRELLGKVVVFVPAPAADPPAVKIRVGEALSETMNDEEGHLEQCLDLSHSLVPDPSGVENADGTRGECPGHRWVSRHLLAFRYVRVLFPAGHRSSIAVACRSHEPLLTQHGSFSCEADDTNAIESNAIESNAIESTKKILERTNLDNRIWRCAAYTLRRCIHNNFIVDGIKRDRLLWAGDLAVGLVANAYAFRDEGCVRWTLSVLDRCGMDELHLLDRSAQDDESGRAAAARSHVNGAVDYSLWLVVAHWLYQRYFGDVPFLRQEWTLVERRLECLVRWCSDAENGRFLSNEDDWVFIDWTVDGEKESALQILWWYALECGTALAQKMACLTNGVRKERTMRIASLMKGTQSRLETSFLEMEDAQLGFSRHSHILGVLSGFYTRLDDRASEGDWSNPDSSDEQWQTLRRCRKLYDRSIKALLGDDLTAVSTPYMKHLECLAISRCGERKSALDRVRSYWGAMLDVGATTFFEAFDPGETSSDITRFYDRPFARSLCHAWAAGPCALCPEICLGLRPLSDGWEQWVCDPLDGIPSASATIKTKYGMIEVNMDRDTLHILIPEGTSMTLMGKVFSSSGRHSFPRKSLISSQSVREWSKKYRDWHHHASHVIGPNPMIPGFEGLQMTDVPTVYQLPRSSLYYLSFVGFDGDGYQTFVAESSDLLHWSNFRLAMGYGDEGMFDHGGVVLGAYLYESYDIHAPRILKRVKGKFFSLYGAYAKKGAYEPDPGYQGLASSEDGLTWRREKDESILSIYGPGIVKEWEKDSIYQPCLVEHNGAYYNFYNAKTMPQWIEQLGLATSKDLHNWTRHNDNPILRVSKRTDDVLIGGFDTQFTSDAKVFFDGDKWVMFYFGVGKGGASIMVAFSRDLIHWVRDPLPLYTAGANPSGLDKQYAHKISLVLRDGSWYMFYCAVGNSGRGIGLITSAAMI